MRILIISLISFLFQTVAYSQQDSTAITQITDVATHFIKLDGYPDFFAVDGNDVWVINNKKIEKLRAGDDKPVKTVEVPMPVGAPIVAFGSIWVANWSDKSVYRIDKTSGDIIAKISTGLANKYGELNLTAGAGSVWVLSDSAGILTRINPKKNIIQEKIKVKPLSFCVAYGYGAIWVTNTGHVEYFKNGDAKANIAGSVQRINTKSNKVEATIPAGLAPFFVAAGEKGIWTLNQGDGTVSRINPYTNKLQETIDVKAPGLGGDIATGAGKVWVRGNQTAFLLTIDPANNKVDERFGPISGSGAVRVTNNNLVWVSSHDVNSIWVIER